MGSRRGNERSSGTLPGKLGGGLPGVPAFVLASDEEITDAYNDDLRLIHQLLAFAREGLALNPVGSQKWLDWATKVDAIRDAIDIHGWAGARRARMFLLASMDGALLHGQRTVACADAIRVMTSLGERTNLTPDERAAVQAAERKLGTDHPTWPAAELFVRATGNPPDDPVLFAAFLFRTVCPKFARGLVTREALSALANAMASWARPKGRPKKGDERMPKWLAADALMKASGLVGTNADSLETDWNEWRARNK